MDKFYITANEERYLVVPSERDEKVTYMVNINGHDIRFIGNPNWDWGGAMLIPEDVSPGGEDIYIRLTRQQGIRYYFCHAHIKLGWF